MCTLKVDASIPKDDQKHVARHLSAIETQKAREERSIFFPLCLSHQGEAQQAGSPQPIIADLDTDNKD
jgi:hypothetical protein